MAHVSLIVANKRFSACSLIGFRQSLSASQQCFSLTTNPHQPNLSAQKPTSEHAVCKIAMARKEIYPTFEMHTSSVKYTVPSQ